MNKSTSIRHKIGDSVTILMHPQLSSNPYDYQEPEETTVVITSADKMGNGLIRYRALSPRSVEWYE